MSDLYFIKAECHQSSREQGYQFAPREIKENYDHSISPKFFTGSRIDMKNGIEICGGYDMLYDHILSLKNNNEQKDKKVITIGGDNSISGSTVAAMNERFMKTFGQKTVSDLKILWIDSFPDLETFMTSITKNLNEMPVASLLGVCEPSLVKHKLLLEPEQFLFLGISDEWDHTTLNEYGFEYYTDRKIRQLGNEIILDQIKDFIDDSPTHVVLDMKVFNEFECPCVYPRNKNGLLKSDLFPILKNIKNNLVAMDITEYNPYLGSTQESKKSRDLIKNCLLETFEIKVNSINIFNENTKFLIYRPTKQDTEEDYGWYILTGISNDTKNDLIKSINDDSIITLDIDDDEYMVTTTTMKEQNDKSYYGTVKVTDTVLFPNEKISMPFELINNNYIENPNE